MPAQYHSARAVHRLVGYINSKYITFETVLDLLLKLYSVNNNPFVQCLCAMFAGCWSAILTFSCFIFFWNVVELTGYVHDHFVTRSSWWWWQSGWGEAQQTLSYAYVVHSNNQWVVFTLAQPGVTCSLCSGLLCWQHTVICLELIPNMCLLVFLSFLWCMCEFFWGLYASTALWVLC